MAAVVRGIEFGHGLGGYLVNSSQATHDVMDEVAQWLGFDGPVTYLKALPKERKRIFERAHD